MEKSELRNFADYSTIYSCGKDLPKIKGLIGTMKTTLKWFRLNSLKANPGEFEFMILGDKTCYEDIIKINLICVQPNWCNSLESNNWDNFLKNILTIYFSRSSINFMLYGVLENALL